MVQQLEKDHYEEIRGILVIERGSVCKSKTKMKCPSKSLLVVSALGRKRVAFLSAIT